MIRTGILALAFLLPAAANAGEGRSQCKLAAMHASSSDLRQWKLQGTCWTRPASAGGRIYGRNSRGDLVCVKLQ